MRWIDWFGGLKLKAIADFLDFGDGVFRSRIKAGTLTADRDLTTPDKAGTIALTSDIPPESAIGAKLRTATDAAAGRAAIYAASDLYPGATFAEPLPATGALNQLVQRSDGSVWIWRSSYGYEGAPRTGWFLRDIADGRIPTVAMIAARNSLAYNANALFPTFLDPAGIRRAINCAQLEVSSDARWGDYSLKISGDTEIAFWDELIAVSAGVVLGFTIAHKQLLENASRTWRLCVACYDGDKSLISLADWNLVAGTATTLAVDYNGGTTMIINTPVTQWPVTNTNATVFDYRLIGSGVKMPSPSNFLTQGHYYPYSKLNAEISSVTNNGDGTSTISLATPIVANANNPYPWAAGREVGATSLAGPGLLYPVITGAYNGANWGVFRPNYSGSTTSSGLFATGGVSNASIAKGQGMTAYIRFGMLGNLGSGAFGGGSLFQIDLNKVDFY